MIPSDALRWVLKIVFLSLIAGLAVFAAISLAGLGSPVLAVLPLVGAGGLIYLFLSPRAYPLRWLAPGVLFLVVMVIYPIGYTFMASTTNVGTGHMLSKTQAVHQLLERTYSPPDAARYAFDAFEDPAGDLALVLTGPSGRFLYAGGEASRMLDPDERAADDDGDGRFDRVLATYRRLDFREVVQRLAVLQTLRIDLEGEPVGLRSLPDFTVLRPLYAYDGAAATMTDLEKGKVYADKEGIFTAEDGEEIFPGYRRSVGLGNYLRLFTSPAIVGPFFTVFGWTFVFAGLTVLLNFSLGLALAMLLNDPFLRLRHVYRVLAVLPYAVPAFVTILVWRGMLNLNFGVVNQILVALFGAGARVAWLESAMGARAALLLVNLWLGFPYMMIIALGALQSIDVSLYEAARVDGARWGQQFRRITLPLLLMPLAPLLIGSFAFNFNNFTLVWLLTEGRPPIIGAQTPAGATDVLITYTYRLAFEGARGNQLGLAASISVLIFLIIATISAINFRLTGTLEELSKNV
ncbi:MAG: maltose ABC transporter permease MalF [Candidatus Bipolaricaulota bacterium]